MIGLFLGIFFIKRKYSNPFCRSSISHDSSILKPHYFYPLNIDESLKLIRAAHGVGVEL